MRKTVLMLICAVFLTLAASAQIGVRLYGKVTDEVGQPVQGAKVGITVFETGSEQTVNVETDKKGRYRAVMMHNSKAYRFVITKDGYQTIDHVEEPGLKRTNFNAPIHADFTLKSGGGSEESISGEAGGGPATYNQGVKALEERDFETARQKFKEAVEAAPEFALARAALASTLYELGEYEEAIVQAKKAVELEANVRSLEILYRAGRDGEDEDAIGEALAGLAEKRPDKATARMLYNDGVTAFEAENFDRAVERFQKAVEIDPNLRQAGRALGRAYLKLGKYEEAREVAEGLVEGDRHDLEALDVLQRAREALLDQEGN